MINGYKIIDFKGIDVSQGATVPGVHDAVIKANKPLVFYNLNLLGEGAIPPFFAPIMNNDDSVLYFTLFFGTNDSATPIVLEIDGDDTVTVYPIS